MFVLACISLTKRRETDRYGQAVDHPPQTVIAEFVITPCNTMKSYDPVFGGSAE